MSPIVALMVIIVIMGILFMLNSPLKPEGEKVGPYILYGGILYAIFLTVWWFQAPIGRFTNPEHIKQAITQHRPK